MTDKSSSRINKIAINGLFSKKVFSNKTLIKEKLFKSKLEFTPVKFPLLLHLLTLEDSAVYVEFVNWIDNIVFDTHGFDILKKNSKVLEYLMDFVTAPAQEGGQSFLIVTNLNFDWVLVYASRELSLEDTTLTLYSDADAANFVSERINHV